MTWGRRASSATVVLGLIVITGCPATTAARRPTAVTFEHRLDVYLDETQLRGEPLGVYLTHLQIEGCMETDEGPLLDALQGMRRLYRQTYERVEAPGRLMVRDAWARSVQDFSPDGLALVETYLDHPPLGRSFYFCDDGLPAAWQTLGAADFVHRARAFADAETEARLATIEGGGADGAVQIEELRQLHDDVLRRFRAQFDEEGADAEVYSALTADLEAAWLAKIDAYDLGRPVAPRPQPHISAGYLAAEEVEWGVPATYSDHPGAANAGAREGAGSQAIPYTPGMVEIPNARDVAERNRVVQSWRKTRRLMLAEARQEAERVEDLLAQLDLASGEAEQQALLRELRRAEIRLEHIAADYGVHVDRVKTTRTGMAVANRMLQRPSRKEVKRTWRKRDRVQEAQETARAAVARAEDELEVAVAEAGGAGESGGGPGTPTDWLGIPADGAHESTAGDTPWTVSEPDDASGNTLVYRGPCPPPDPEWSDEVVAALQARYPSLDGTDARIFLGLLARTFPQIGGRAEIEAVVFEHVERNLDLQLREGHADGLSEIWDPARGVLEQDEITFYLTLEL